ncbi:MAG: CHASE2 domain-containing protein [Fimbriimonadaceae bacterium]|nr:CHASE2 domain-containing protein [Fimbriimonadaceae bacterium]
MSAAQRTSTVLERGLGVAARQALVMAVVAAVLAMVLSAEGAFEPLSRFVSDRRLRRDDVAAFRRGELQSPAVAILDVPAMRLVAWRAGEPGARAELAGLLRRLSSLAPRAVVLDATLESNGVDDELLQQAIRASGKVVLAAEFDSPRPSVRGLTLPLLAFRLAAAGQGYRSWTVDNDSVARHFSLALPEVAELSLPLVGWAVATETPLVAVRNSLRRYQALPDGRVLDDQYHLNFSFRGPPGTGFRTVRLRDLPDQEAALRGQVVVVGTLDQTAPGVLVPLSASWRPDWQDRWAEPMSRTELLAGAIDTLLEDRAVREVHGGSLYAVVFLAAYLVALASLATPGRQAVIVALAVGTVWWVVGAALWSTLHVDLPLAEAVTAMLLCLAVGLYQGLHREMAVSRAVAARADAERQRLAELDSAKRAVLGTVVHDLKVPVAIVKGQALTLLADPERELGLEVHQEFLETIAAQCDRLTAMVEDILDTDPDRQLTVHREQCDLGKLVRHVVAMHEATANRHSFRVEAPTSAAAMVDPAKISRVLNNLVSNAVKYSPRGGEVIVILDQPSPAEVAIRVRDSGIGMTPDQVAKLFGLFVRVIDNPASIPGTGVGLYSTKRLVEAHGGRIEVSSERGAGSEFRVVLPTANGTA